MKTLARALMVTCVVSTVAVVARPVAERAWFVYTLATQEAPALLPSPLAARRPPRFAPKDTPVLSTTSGVVMRVGTNSLGGQVVWILGPGFERHYYAHLNRYGAFRPGDRVAAGNVIGYAGNTGNARGGAVHLHYGVYRNGAARNPYPRLANGARKTASRPANAGPPIS